MTSLTTLPPLSPLANTTSAIPKVSPSPPLLQKLISISLIPASQLPGHDKTDDNYVRWGQDFRALKTNQDEQGLYWFDDTYKGAIRLNILGHSQVNANGKGEMQILLEGEPATIDGADLKYMYEHHYGKETLQVYQHIRVISCCSADGDNPLGQQVASAFNRETKAFSGYVDSLSPEAIVRKKFNHEFKSEDGTATDLNHALKVTGRSFVQKTMPSAPEKQKLWPGYHPIKFRPT